MADYLNGVTIKVNGEAVEIAAAERRGGYAVPNPGWAGRGRVSNARR